ncbi:hypothetical protein NB717_003019 [Xanthomonas sacchari]|uniref:hypothetical protein n=1 Tax=Xanthomonas TaxID=338 RepID=UPI0012632C6E|nr:MULTISPECIES: hypothetical protein [Xanthomonas]KAB7775973.1 hypothetical protein CEK65_14340 [Xanthomonas sp. LMG 12459]MCW0386658.1 hypothetical protein [Xanthomonas sacchari]MCW0458768.1 hypothetical protein [Xanthomonas sacchari]MCW0461951.1 hypothetical protein [Xanthomonas sacchari]UYK80258.1 hypothetical protein NG829_18280 [Xanthomonas sacchari]
MRILVLLMALAMPLVAWFSQRGAFGPTNGAISDRYPTLIVAAGYAFAIWGVIFLLDLAFGLWQSSARRRRVSALAQVRAPAALGFALTAAWMPVFSQQHFLLALAVIWTALAAMLLAALRLSRDPAPESGQTLWAWLPLSLHAGWLSLAAFLNTAQVIVAYRWLSTERMLPWSLVLFALAAVLLLGMNRAMRGNLAYAAAALWALAAVYVKQAASTLAGAQSAAWVALLLAAVLALQTLWLRLRARR